MARAGKVLSHFIAVSFSNVWETTGNGQADKWMGRDFGAFGPESDESIVLPLALSTSAARAFWLSITDRAAPVSPRLGSNLDRGVRARPGRAIGGPGRLQAASPQRGKAH